MKGTSAWVGVPFFNSTLSHFQFGVCGLWIPAFAGMTVTFFQRIFCFVIPAKAGIQSVNSNVTK